MRGGRVWGVNCGNPHRAAKPLSSGCVCMLSGCLHCCTGGRPEGKAVQSAEDSKEAGGGVAVQVQAQAAEEGGEGHVPQETVRAVATQTPACPFVYQAEVLPLWSGCAGTSEIIRPVSCTTDPFCCLFVCLFDCLFVCVFVVCLLMLLLVVVGYRCCCCQQCGHS